MSAQDSAETVRLTNPDVARYPDRSLIGLARNIVNQILDESGASVERRQSINDRCDRFVHDLLAARLAAPAESGLREALGRLAERADYVTSEVCKDHGLTDSVDRMLSDSPDVRDRLGYADGIRSAVLELRAVLGDDGEA